MRFGLRVSQAEALEPLLVYLRGLGCRPLEQSQVDVLFSYRVGGVRARGREDFHLLYSAARQVVRTHDPAQIEQQLWQQIQLTGGSLAPEWLVLSSGLIEWKGRGVLLVSPARSGRTSLLQALAQHGARALSDELCPIDEQGRVHTASRSPLPLAGALLTRYHPASSTRLRRIPPAQTCVELFKCCLGARQQPQRILQHLARVAPQIPCWKGTRGPTEGGIEAVLSGLDRWFR